MPVSGVSGTGCGRGSGGVETVIVLPPGGGAGGGCPESPGCVICVVGGLWLIPDVLGGLSGSSGGSVGSSPGCCGGNLGLKSGPSGLGGSPGGGLNGASPEGRDLVLPVRAFSV